MYPFVDMVTPTKGRGKVKIKIRKCEQKAKKITSKVNLDRKCSQTCFLGSPNATFYSWRFTDGVFLDFNSRHSFVSWWFISWFFFLVTLFRLGFLSLTYLVVANLFRLGNLVCSLVSVRSQYLVRLIFLC